MTEQEELQRLWQYGRFRDPRVADAHNVRKVDLVHLTFSHPVVKDVLAAYQQDMKPVLDAFTLQVHGRESIADGEKATATAAFFEYPRCGHPDFEVSEADDPDVGKLWNKQEANWPDACRREILVGRDFDSLPGLDLAKTDQVYHALCNNWSLAIADIDMLPVLDSRTRSNERMFHRREAMSGSTLAYHYLARNRCDDWLDGAWNSRVNWADLSLPCTTGTHEVGHGLGMNHNNDPNSTLYPSINPGARQRYGYPNATDVQTLRSLGYTPHADWEVRRPSLEDLLRPRDGDDEEPPSPVPPTDIERTLREHSIQLAYHEALIKILLRR